jgi:hypothetical protein
MPERWRQGRSVGRTVYIGDTLVGVMDSPALAEQVVAVVNATAHLWDVAALDLFVTSVGAEDQLGNQNARGVEIRHRPTGMTVRQVGHRARIQNMSAAIHELRARLLATIPGGVAVDPADNEETSS